MKNNQYNHQQDIKGLNQKQNRMLCLIFGVIIFIGLQIVILNKHVVSQEIKLEQSATFKRTIHQYTQDQLNKINSEYIKKSDLPTPIIQTKPPVYNYGSQKQYPYQYIRSTTTQIITFPQQFWVPDSLEDIKFNNFPQYATSQDTSRIRQFFSDRIYFGEIPEENMTAYYYEMLHQYPNLPSLIEYEYYYLNDLYNINQSIPEKSFCVVSVGFNLFKKKYHHRYLRNLESQNYTNFNIVWIDDNSGLIGQGNVKYDQVFGMYRDIYKKYPRLMRRIKLIKNQGNVGAFANYDTGIKEHCKPGDIIVPLDGDDALIGRQTLKTLNILYHQKQAWAVYTNFLSNNRGYPNPGYSRQLNIRTNQYRTSYVTWRTTHLKTYLMDLYVKIPMSHLVQYGQEIQKIGITEIHKKFLNYPRYTSDQAMFFSIIQMAGKDRLVFIPELFYYYFRNPASATSCYRAQLLFDEAKARILTPLKKISHLSDPVKLQKAFPNPKLKKYNQLKEEYIKKCRRQ